jgi:glutamyl-Q tRNA(Asp) synthetase
MMSADPPVFRFAPSPTGHLHLGHAYSALLNKQLAEEAGGRLLLRIEDIDTSRCRPEYEAAMLDDLAWLGLKLEQPVRRQSEHQEEYRAILEQLKAKGLVYPSFASRAEAKALAGARGPDWPTDPDGVPLYAGPERDWSEAQKVEALEQGEQVAWRLDMLKAAEMAGPLTWKEAEEGEVACDPRDWGDVVIARVGSSTSYHLSVVLDDAVQGVSHIVRGTDLRAATAVHRLLQTLLDLPQPTYRHHGLVLDEEGSKLSKRDGAQSLAQLRAEGATPTDIASMVGL